MRSLTAAIVTAVAFVVSAGLALSSPIPMKTRPAPARTAPTTSGIVVADCPTPTIHTVDASVRQTSAGPKLRIRVIVQNVGTRSFLADKGDAFIGIRVGADDVGRYSIERLGIGEVRFFVLETVLKPGAPRNVSARLYYAPSFDQHGCPAARMQKDEVVRSFGLLHQAL